MTAPTDREIRHELEKGYGHVIGAKRVWNIRIAHALRTLSGTSASRRLQEWRNQLMAVLKVEDQVLKSYDRMAGVYNEVNQTLRNDSSFVLCKYNGEYVRRAAKDIYADQLRYFSEAVMRPRLRDDMTILEIGAGETTTIHNLMSSLAPLNLRWSGLELSWSRIAEGRRWAIEHDTMGQIDHLVAASAVDIPFADDSFDVVFTNGCVEQIRYGTERALSEILRVARHTVILYEPSYELGDKYQRIYLEGAQYCRGIPALLNGLGANVVRHELAPHSFNPFCCYAVTVIEKAPKHDVRPPSLSCPQCKKALKPIAEGYFCDSVDCSCVYPSIWNIACLRQEDAIFASKYVEMVTASKRTSPDMQSPPFDKVSDAQTFT
jgi:SAM-dependent methyltransferase